MKRMLTLIISLFLITPLAVSADEFGVTCTESEMVAMQSELDKVKIEVEYLPEGTKIKLQNGEIEVSNKFKVISKGLPDNYIATLYADSKKTTSYIVSDGAYSILDNGGVYIVDFNNTKCGLGVIKSYELMIPYFDKNNETNVWYDGTNLTNDSEKNTEIVNSFNLELKLILVVIIIALICIFIIIKRKRKKMILNLMFLILLPLCGIAFTNDVKAFNFIVDNGGQSPDGLAIPSDGIIYPGTGSYIFTGVGYKVSLVNIESLETVSNFFVILNRDYLNGYCYGPNSEQLCWRSRYNLMYDSIVKEGVYGKIPLFEDGTTYSAELVPANDVIEVETPIRAYGQQSLEAWFLNQANSNAPNVSQEKIANRLITKSSDNHYEPTDLFYEYVAKLLKNGAIREISDVDTINKVKDFLENDSRRLILKDYRMVIEPLYGGNVKNAHRVFTVKGVTAYSSAYSKVNFAYPNLFLKNFMASQVHGQINKNSNTCDLTSSTSGCGYIIFGIVDDEQEEKKCNPYGDANSNCCYERAGWDSIKYNESLTGVPFEGGFYCNKIDPKTKKCLGKAQMCIENNTCIDKTTKASCNSNNGTKAVFHENDNLKACTLDSTKKSGFTIISEEDTTPSSKNTGYCEVACKDDFDFELPMKKFAIAGTYFTLDNYTPKVNIKRTCVTSKINYSTFKSDLDEARDNMIAAYNTWQDYKEYYNHTLTIQVNESESGKYNWQSGGECNGYEACKPKEGEETCTGKGPCNSWTPVVENECSYTIYTWFDNGYVAKNGTNFAKIGGAEGNYADKNCPNYPSTSSRKYLQNRAASNADVKYSNYISAKNKYIDILAKYQKCGTWVTEKTLGIDPKLKLQYNDLDSTVFNNKNLTHENTLANDLTTVITYWDNNSTTNDKYSTGGDNTEDSVKITYVQCSGTTCTNGSGNQITVLTSSYIKREESITYTYHLPTIYSSIPSGKVYSNNASLKSYIALEKDAVPINVITSQGLYDYTIQVTNLTDSVRKNAKNKTIDNLETRFTNSKVISGKGNDGNSYVCDYKVENDIYNPNTKKNMFFYRPVELTDINPLGRDLGYNWSDSKADAVKKNMKTTGNDYAELTMTGRDKFEFTLTPSVMKAIRSYNVTHDYGGYNLTCSSVDGPNYHCTSAFLNCLASLSTLATSSNLCDNILEGRNLTNKTDYGYDDLQANRNILIDKLMKLP